NLHEVERGRKLRTKLFRLQRKTEVAQSVGNERIDIFSVWRETYPGWNRQRVIAILVQKDLDLCPGNWSCTAGSSGKDSTEWIYDDDGRGARNRSDVLAGKVGEVGYARTAGN